MFRRVFASRNTTRPVRRALAFVLMLVLTAGAASSIASAKAVYVIYDGETRTVVESSSYVPSEVVARAGIEVSGTDRIDAEHNEDGHMEIFIRHRQNVTVNYMGATLVAQAYQEPVGDFLERLGFEIGEDDIVSLDLSSYTSDGLVIDVTKVIYETFRGIEPVAYEIEGVKEWLFSNSK